MGRSLFFPCTKFERTLDLPFTLEDCEELIAKMVDFLTEKWVNRMPEGADSNILPPELTKLGEWLRELGLTMVESQGELLEYQIRTVKESQKNEDEEEVHNYHTSSSQ